MMTAPARTPSTRRRRYLPLIALISVTIAGLTLAVGLHRAPADPTGADSGPVTRTPGTVAAPLSGQTLDGGHFDLSRLRGQVVLVNVFASWCGPCRTELPLLAEAHRRWSERGLRLVGLAVRDDDDSARRMLREAGVETLPVLVDRSGTVAVDWGAVGVPETFVVDRDGRVAHWARGPITQPWLDQRVAPLLNP
ncbi:TlpA family protein disulfide reductase [Micromonospora sonneratiae]|uniref:TlpA family protein disulfide reductase n=1 Tax=Micromonospora sonneratiae TaxID=1184706 RepID=A0ABW3Y7X8_9ACTN